MKTFGYIAGMAVFVTVGVIITNTLINTVSAIKTAGNGGA